MLDPFDNSQDETLRIRDMRDLRFMAEIYGRQGRSADLLKLWEQPPPALQEIMGKFSTDLTNLKVEIASRCQDWKVLEDVCLKTIDRCLELVETSHSSQALVDLCSQTWSVWNGLLQAYNHLYSIEE